SAFLRANTLRQMIVIRPGEGGAGGIHAREILKIKLEVDTDPPPGFATESRTVLLPVPFAVRVYTLPDLFAGKMHALLCRKWGGRVKGRDWYDFVWYAARHPACAFPIWRPACVPPATGPAAPSLRTPFTACSAAPWTPST
ncbi:MAG TPA: nucleotidyl transferase AbiEii/AbiGii toxin family protein, partial [Candidatus Hydrogenedentes bacterium]|nr:nucleotidyl transferase AbiEii/AbiGii toxin family protein [Candidatus Hydrogenedentota bacterium]